MVAGPSETQLKANSVMSSAVTPLHARVDLPRQPTPPFDVARWTNAPMRMTGTFHFAASREVVFEKVGDPKILASWFPTIYGGTLDHGQSCNIGEWGEGSKRLCYTHGMGTIDETVLLWEPPRAYAYTAKNAMMPIRDHVAAMTLTELGPSETSLRWDQYFNLKGLVMRHMFPSVMTALMNRGLANLAKELGGKGGRMRIVR